MPKWGAVDVGRLEDPFEQQHRLVPAEFAHAHGFVEIEQRDAVGRCEARVDPLDAMTVRIGLDHGPHARLRGGAADEVEVVADGVRSDVGGDGTGHGDVSDRMSFGARGGAGSAAWRDNASGQW